MVLKHSKHGLNTGNTIRRSQACSLVKGKRTYGYVFIDRDDGLNKPDSWTYKLGTPMRDVMKAMPDRNVEYSLKKQQRWKCAAIMERKLAHHADSELKITLTERVHRAEPILDITEEPCIAYQSNNGAVLSRFSHTDMQYKTAMVPTRVEDSLTKRERRRLKKAGVITNTKRNAPNQAEQSQPQLSGDETSFNCHVTYGARNDGRLYKDACTRLAGSRCRTGQHSGKMEESRVMRSITSERVDSYADTLYDEEDEDTVEETKVSTDTVVNLTDLIATFKSKRKSRRSCSEEDEDDFIMI